jgi:hypothetical protein
MRYRVRIFSHPNFEGLAHTVAVFRAIKPENLPELLLEYVSKDSEGVRAVIEDEQDWRDVEMEIEREEAEGID